MFDRLADFIIKHYKLVIVVWIILLFYAFPLNLDLPAVDGVSMLHTEYSAAVKSLNSGMPVAQATAADSGNGSTDIVWNGWKLSAEMLSVQEKSQPQPAPRQIAAAQE